MSFFVAESGTELRLLSARCQELDQECERLIADVNAHEKDVRGMEDFLRSLRKSAAKDSEALYASFEDDIRSVLR